MEDGHPSVSSSRANAALKSLGPLSLLDCPHNASVPGRPHAERDQGRGDFPSVMRAHFKTHPQVGCKDHEEPIGARRRNLR